MPATETEVFPDTILEPSLHAVDKVTDILREECESRGIPISPRPPRRDDFRWLEIEWEHQDYLLQQLRDFGYENIEDNDTILIMPKGQPLPKEWTEGFV